MDGNPVSVQQDKKILDEMYNCRESECMIGW